MALDSTPEPYLFFSQGHDLRLASTLRSGGAPPQNYLSGLCLIDTVLHSINRDRKLRNLGPGNLARMAPRLRRWAHHSRPCGWAGNLYLSLESRDLTLTPSGFRSLT
jgi:hypothetical protein